MSIDRDKARALDKIRKLLKLAKDGRGNVTEAETALRQAQALMAKFNIDEAEATAKDLSNNPEAVMRAWVKAGYHARAILATIPDWAGIIAMGVGKLYECRVMVGRGTNGAKGIVFGGYVVDVTVAVWTFEYLLDCVRRSGDRYEKAVQSGRVDLLKEFGLTSDMASFLKGRPSKGRKADFREQMAASLQHRLFTLAEERAAAQTKSVAGNALMVSKEAMLNANFGKQLTKQAVAEEEGKKPPKEKPPSLHDLITRAAALREADKVRLDPGPVGHTPAAAPPLLGRT